MRFLLLLAVIFSFSAAYAHESDIAHVHSADVATMMSNVVVQGTVVSINNCDTKRYKNSAIINDFICWEGEAYTFNPTTGKLTIRSINDEEHKLPSLKLILVEKGEVNLEYSDSNEFSPLVFKKKLKPRS